MSTRRCRPSAPPASMSPSAIQSGDSRSNHQMPAAASTRAPRLLMVVNDEVSFLARRLEIARQASNSGFEVHVALPARDSQREMLDPAVETIPQSLNDAVSAGLFTVHPIRMTRGANALLKELRTVLELRRVMRRVRPDIVHQFAIKPTLFGTLAARTLSSVPYGRF